AIGHRASRGDAQWLTCEASLAEELTSVQNGNDRFLALLRCHRQLHLALPQVEHGIRGFSLRENGAVRGVFYSGFPAGDSSEERFPIGTPLFFRLHEQPPPVLYLQQLLPRP